MVYTDNLYTYNLITNIMDDNFQTLEINVAIRGCVTTDRNKLLFVIGGGSDGEGWLNNE